MHYYQFNIGDYHSHTNHLEPLEDLAYRRMLDWSYLNEIPLPVDLSEIGRLIRMRSHSDCIEIVLRDFFTLTDDGYIQSRIMTEVDAYREKSKKAKKSAEARWNKQPSKDKGLGDANALQAQSEGNAKHKPLTTKHKTITKEIVIPDGINNSAWKEWVDYRKSKKKTVSQAAAKKQFKFLTNYALDLQQQIIDQSIQNDYQGLFEPKGNNDGTENRPKQTSGSGRQTLPERVAENIAKQRAARGIYESDGEGVAETPSHVRLQVHEPVRGDAGQHMGELFEGDYTKADS